MTRDGLMQIVVDKAVGILQYDDANPDVGWGMFAGTAVDIACRKTIEEAALWRRDVNHFVTDAFKKEACEKVRERRKR